MDNTCDIIYDDEFGTKENENPDWKTNGLIANISDILEFLKRKINRWNSSKFYGWKTKSLATDDKFNKYTSPKWTKMGEINIYEDRRPYEFIPSTY